MKSPVLIYFFQKHPIGRHIGFWLLVYLTFVISHVTVLKGDYSLNRILVSNLTHLPSHLLAAYSLNYLLIPILFRKKKYLLFAVFFLASSYLISVFDRFVSVYINEPLFREGVFAQESAYELFTQINNLLESYFPKLYFVALAMTLIRVAQANTRMKEANLLLEKEKTISELNFLKAQLHPHFLFNTLNNLYSLTLSKSDKAPDTVARLSEILDYTLYRTSKEFVPVEKEVKAIEDYISLEKLRYGDRIEVTFKKDIDNYQTRISPLILLSVVENAFKHGAGVHHPTIYLELRIKHGHLCFTARNKKNKDAAQKQSPGIGISNIKKQLTLLYHNFGYKIDDKEGAYHTTITVDLTSQKMFSSLV